MIAGLSKLATALKLLKDKHTRNIGRKIVIIILSPFIALLLLIGGIFSDGIDTNHSIVQDLFYGRPIDTTDMSNIEKKFIADVQDGLEKLNTKIEKIDRELTEGTLNRLQIKGYYIGIVFTEQYIKLDDAKAKAWVYAFTKEEKVETESEESTESTENTGNTETEKKTNRYLVTSNKEIYENLEDSFSITLDDDTKEFMKKVYKEITSGGGGNSSGTVVTLSDEEIQALVDNLPDGTSKMRKDIIIQAADAVGKIPYYWGGTASGPGYDGNDFGVPTTPDADGRSLKGLDCSHFVDWVYWTVVGNNLGNTSTHGQITQCDKISESELQPGDLAFLLNANGVTTHVGIYAGEKDGQHIWIHENAAANNVSMDNVSYWSGYYRLHIMKGK